MPSSVSPRRAAALALALVLASSHHLTRPARAQVSRPVATAAQAATHAARSHFAGRVAHMDRESKGGSMVTG